MECGCQFSLYPMTDRFVDVILPAVDRLQHPTLIVETDDLSTLVRGEAAAVFAAIRDVFITASESGIHVVSNILFSRGCPGEEECGIPPSPEDVAATKAASLPPPPQDYGDVAAQFSLYPLGREDYMEQIYAAVDQAKNSGTFGRSKNFCTRLDGTAGNVFHSIFEAFVSAPADHVVAHATISANSPSKKGA